MEWQIPPESLARAMSAAGLGLWRKVSGETLGMACEAMPSWRRLKFGLDRARSAVVAALPYGEGLWPEPAWAQSWAGPRAALARFARANWYRELALRLKAASQTLRAEAAGREPAAAARHWRFLVNSGIPEKAIARLSGLGKLGRHSLLMVEDAGPGCVLGVLLLPYPIAGIDRAATAPGEPGPGPKLGEDCGSCRACIEACPTGALAWPGSYDRERCLQHWATVEGELPPRIHAAWGDRLYGCDTCLEACPRFRPETTAAARTGLVGARLPTSWFEAASDAEIRERLHGSALGQLWIPAGALRRNARRAAAFIDGKV